MSVLRQQNWMGQQRVDVPHLRSLESSLCADFDLVAGSILAGSKPVVVQGFDILTASAVGNAATNLQLNVAGGVVMHPTASESGTIFAVPAGTAAELLNATNTNVVGSFTANQTNYIGLDLARTADDSTADVVQFLDANTLSETPKSVDLARTLKYRIVISTIDFASTPNLLPIAIVVTDANGLVTTLTDARQLMFRLGSGGTSPSASHSYPWPAGRAENTTGSVFSGGDKQIGSLKDWSDAIMTRLWELGGGQYWYSPVSDRDLKLAFGSPVIVATGDNFQWTLGSSTLQWQSLSVLFGNGTVSSNDIADGTAVLADGQCLYVDVDRTTAHTGGTALTPQVANLVNLGTPTIPGSRFVIAWRKGSYVYVKDKAFEVGRTFPIATISASGTVDLLTSPANTWTNYPSATVAIANTKAASTHYKQVIAAGLSRGDVDSNVGAGPLSIGTDTTNDTSIAIGNHSANTTISVSNTLTLDRTIGLVGIDSAIADGIQIGASIAQHILIGHLVGGTTTLVLRGDSIDLASSQPTGNGTTSFLIEEAQARGSADTIVKVTVNSTPIATLKGDGALSAGSYSYNTPPSQNTYVTPENFVDENPSAANHWTLQRYAISSDGIWNVAVTPTATTIIGRVRLPAGAIVTGVKFLALNASGGTPNYSVSVTGKTFLAAPAISGALWTTTTIASATVAMPASMTAWAWFSVALGGSPTAPTDGWVAVEVVLPATAGNQFGGVQISYTRSQIAPEV